MITQALCFAFAREFSSFYGIILIVKREGCSVLAIEFP